MKKCPSGHFFYTLKNMQKSSTESIDTNTLYSIEINICNGILYLLKY